MDKTNIFAFELAFSIFNLLSLFLGSSDSSVRSFASLVQKSVEKWFFKVDHFEFVNFPIVNCFKIVLWKGKTYVELHLEIHNFH